MTTATSTAQTLKVTLRTQGMWHGHVVTVETDRSDWPALLHCEGAGHDLHPITDEDGNPTEWLMCYRCLGLADNPEFPQRETNEGSQP